MEGQADSVTHPRPHCPFGVGPWVNCSQGPLPGVHSVSGENLKTVNLICLNPWVFFYFLGISQHTLKKSSLFDAIRIAQVNQRAPTLLYWSTAVLGWEGLASSFCQKSWLPAWNTMRCLFPFVGGGRSGLGTRLGREETGDLTALSEWDSLGF